MPRPRNSHTEFRTCEPTGYPEMKQTIRGRVLGLIQARETISKRIGHHQRHNNEISHLIVQELRAVREIIQRDIDAEGPAVKA